MYEIRALHPDEMDQWFDLLTEQFSVPRAYFERHWQNDPWCDRDGIRVATAGGRLLASVRVFRRQLYLGGAAVTTGGIGEVCTRSECRGQGLSGTLLRDAIRWMERESFALSLLFADLHDHYGRHGWQVAPMERGLTTIPTSTNRLRITGLEAAPLPALAALYEGFSPRFQGALVRSQGYWERWWRAEQQTTRVAWAHGRPVAYLSARRLVNGDVQVDDFAAAPDADTSGLLLQLAAEVAAALGTPSSARLRYPVAICPELRPVAVDRISSAMYRVIRPDLLPAAAGAILQEALAGRRPDLLWWPVDGF